MADEEIVIRTRLEDAGVVEQLERQARAVEDLQRRAGAGSRAGAAGTADWMGEPPALARLRAQAERVATRAADLQRTAGEIEARAAAEQAASTARLNSLLAGATTAARLAGNWQAGGALQTLGGLTTAAGGAATALLGIAGGLTILATTAGRTAIHLGELALKTDALARGGANAKTSLEQAAAAAERLQVGLGRYVAPILDTLATQRAALLSTLAQQTGRQTLDEAVQNALARERAAQQRLEDARRRWTNIPPAEQENIRRMSYAQAALGGMGMAINPYGPPVAFASAEADAAALTIERLRAQLAQASAALAAVQSAGGPGMNLREGADWLSGRLQEQAKYVAALKKEIADYQALALEVQEATQRGLRGDRDAAAYAERLAEKLKTVNVDRLKQTLQDAQDELQDLTSREHEVRVKVFWEEYGAAATRRGTAGMLPDVAAQFPGTPFGMTNFQEWLTLQNLSLTTPSGLGPPLGPDTQFNLQQAPWQEALAYMRYREAQANLPLAAALSRQVSPPAPPRGAAGSDRLESILRGLIGQGPSTAVGLGDLRGGTYGGGPLAPGAGGPFEALYRIQDIAMNWEHPGPDTRRWAEMYGLGPEQARAISRQFQMGFFSPEVMKYVDVQGLVDTANMMELAEKSQEALAKELAKRGANPDNIKRLLGIAGKDEGDTSPYRPAVDAILSGMNAELTNRADSVEATGRRWWGLIEKGLVEGARDSDVLLSVLRSLIVQELNNMVPLK